MWLDSQVLLSELWSFGWMGGSAESVDGNKDDWDWHMWVCDSFRVTLDARGTFIRANPGAVCEFGNAAHLRAIAAQTSASVSLTSGGETWGTIFVHWGVHAALLVIHAQRIRNAAGFGYESGRSIFIFFHGSLCLFSSNSGLLTLQFSRATHNCATMVNAAEEKGLHA